MEKTHEFNRERSIEVFYTKTSAKRTSTRKKVFRERRLTVSQDGTHLLRYLSIDFKLVTSFLYLLVTLFSLGNPKIVGLLVGE